MPKRGGNISLTSYDDIFETDESRAESQLERVQNISISELVPFKDHPFKVVDDEAMLRTTESIAQYGVLTPLIARPLEAGGYEIISGHRRAHAAELAGLTEVPVLVRQKHGAQSSGGIIPRRVPFMRNTAKPVTAKSFWRHIGKRLRFIKLQRRPSMNWA